MNEWGFQISLKFFSSFYFAVVNQFYKAEILTEYVIRGNTVVLKCSIPSFVADFVHVEAWIDEDGKLLNYSNNFGNFYIFANFFLFVSVLLFSSQTHFRQSSHNFM